MYYYLVDAKSYDGKNFEYFQTQLLSLLGEYHIAGEVARITKLRTTEDLVNTALSYGATTLVVVGGDETFTKVLTLCHNKNITLGYIPTNFRSEIAKILGISNLLEAVALIAKRRVEELDLAKIDQTYFLSNIYFGFLYHEQSFKKNTLSLKQLFSFRPFEIELIFDNSFRAHDKFIAGAIINTHNQQHCNFSEGPALGNPKDEKLDIILISQLSKFRIWRYRKLLLERCFEALPNKTIFHAQKVEFLLPGNLPLFLSGQILTHTPQTISIAGSKARVIVGKSRQFLSF